jgi:hypothetical protein
LFAELAAGTVGLPTGTARALDYNAGRARLLWQRLSGYSPGQRLAVVREGREFQNAALCVLVCEESVRVAADLPAPALDLAELAVEIAPLVAAPEPWRRRLEGYAWAFLGNARRVACKPGAADEAFSRSARLCAPSGAAD